MKGLAISMFPWIHDAKTTDMVVAVDDEVTIRLLRLFNEPKGRECLKKNGADPATLARLDQMGISSIGNLAGAIKFAKYYELTENDVVATVFTDSLELYGSRLSELTKERGAYSEANAWQDLELMHSIATDNLEELTYTGKKRIHNLKYFTWIEQQARELSELNRQWYDHDKYWNGTFAQASKINELIVEFNDRITHA